MRSVRNTVWLMVWWVVTCGAGSARGDEVRPSDVDTGLSAGLTQVFNQVPAFSTAMTLHYSHSLESTRMSLPVRVLKRQDRFRIEVDLGRLEGSGLLLPALAGSSKLGLSRVVGLVLPGERHLLVLFPELKSYTRFALTEIDFPEDGYRVWKRGSTKETVLGYECLRRLVTITGNDGFRVQGRTWEAAPLKDFPVQLEFGRSGHQALLTASSVSLDEPADDLFRVPEGYQPFNSLTGVVQDAMARVLSLGVGR